MIMEGEDKTFNRISQVDIDYEKWLSGSEYTCKVAQDKQTKESSISICSALPISSPSLHLKSDENKGVFTATCEVFTAYKSKVFWFLDEKEIEAKDDHDFKNSQNGNQGFVHNKKFTEDKWTSMKSIACEVRHKCFTSVRQTLSLSALRPTFPSITLNYQLTSEPSKAKRVTLVCLLTGFYPKDISVEWKEDEKPLAASPTERNMEGEDKTFNRISQVDIDYEKWLSGSEYTCKVTQNRKTNESSISICSALPNSSPSLHLKSDENKGVFTATCEVFTAHKSKVFWFLDEKEIEAKDDHDFKNSQNGNQGFVHRETFTEEKWTSMKSIACEVRHKCFTSVRQTLSLSALRPTFPSITLNYQLTSEPSKAKGVTLVCLLTGFYPKDISVEWKEDKKPLAASPTERNMEGEDKTFNRISQVDIDYEQWLSGSEYTCKVTQNRKTNESSISICSALPNSSPSLHLKSDENKGVFTATCEVFTAHKSKVFWFLDEKEIEAKDDHDFKNSQNGNQGFVHRETFTEEKWTSMKSIACEVRHKCFTSVRQTLSLSALRPTFPSITLNYQLTSEPSKAKGVTLVCLLTGFYPKDISVEWKEDKKPLAASPTERNMEGEDKTFNRISQVDIDYEQWLSGSEYTCKVTQNRKTNESSISICSALPNSSPSLHLKSDENKGVFTATCEVFTAHKSKVFWFLDEKEIEAKDDHDFKNSQNGNQGFVHRETFTEEKWTSMKSIACEVRHKCFTSVRQTLSLSALRPTFPSITLNYQLTSEPSKAKGVTLVCLLTGFYPKDISVEWKEDKKPLAASPTERNMEGEDKTFNRISQVDIDYEQWLSGSEYTCKVTQNRKTNESSISICSALPISSPSLHLKSDENKGVLTATCEVFTAYKSKVFWLLGESEIEAKDNQDFKNPQNGNQGFVHSRTLTEDQWKSMKSIACEVRHKCFTSVRQTLSLSAQRPTFPSITLNYQLTSEPSKAKGVTLVCLLTGFYPKDISVEWKEDKNPLAASPTERNMEGEDKTFNRISQVDIDYEKWLSGSEYTCKVTQNTQTKESSINICSAHPISSPSLHLKSDENKGVFTASCEVFTTYKSKVFWLLGEEEIEAKDNQDFKNPQNGNQGFVHNRTFTEDQWKSMKSIACEVRHKCFTSVRQTLNLTGETSAELYLQQGPQKPGREVQKCVCLVSGFNPQVIWLLESVETPAAASRTVREKDGHTVVASEIEVPQEKWLKGVLVTCMVNDQALVQPILKNISICTVTPPSTQTAELFLIGPPLQDTQSEQGIPFVCLLIGFDARHFSIIWKVNGKEMSLKSKTRSRNDNGTETLESTLNAKKSDWHRGSRITCQARHLCSDKPIERHLVKAQDPRAPTVRIIVPSDSELAGSSNASLLCLVSDYLPSPAEVHWELNGERLPASRYSSTPPLRLMGSRGYAMHSWLPLPESVHTEGKYSCVVGHESSKTPVNHTISVFGPAMPPQAVLLQFSEGLICLVHGFSPAPINVTWVLNGETELLGSNTSDVSRAADGTFMLWSHLQVTWEPGASYTCRVAHVTKTLSLSKSQPEISSENMYFNENANEPLSEESLEEIWNTAFIFLAIFLIALLYSIGLTFAVIK